MPQSVDPTQVENPNRAIVDKAPKPAGIMPKNLQSMVMIGIAVLMVLIMWLTGGGKKAATSPKPTVPATPPVMPTDTAQVQDFEKRIQSEQQAARRAVPGTIAPQTGLAIAPGYGGYDAASVAGNPGWVTPPPGAFPQSQEQPIAPPPPNPIEVDRKKRAYESLFASNVALTYRKSDEGTKLLGADSEALNRETSSSPSNPNTQTATMSELAALAAQDPQLELVRSNQLPAQVPTQTANQSEPQPILQGKQWARKISREAPLKLPALTRPHLELSTRLPVPLTFFSRERRSTRC